MIDKLLYCTSGCLTYSGILLAIIQEYYLQLTVAEKGKSVFFSGVALDILNTHQRRLYTETKHTPGFFFLCLVWFDVYVCALFVLERKYRKCSWGESGRSWGRGASMPKIYGLIFFLKKNKF